MILVGVVWTGFNEFHKVFFVLFGICFLFFCLLKSEGISLIVFAVSPLKLGNFA